MYRQWPSSWAKSPSTIWYRSSRVGKSVMAGFPALMVICKLSVRLGRYCPAAKANVPAPGGWPRNAFCLGGSYIFKVEGQQPAGEELLVDDSPPLFLDELLDLFMVDSCHAATPLTRFSAVWERTPDLAQR